MEHTLSYNFGEIEYTVRQEIHATSARLNAALDDLRAQIAPLQEIWTRQAAQAYRVEQARSGAPRQGRTRRTPPRRSTRAR
ncbi:hypothetical protein [Mycolicibacterium holsaticum]|uniref:hypothetical protein n=1 Tax=Mycolicibacterium holsaticum TaxID=152142 RepID=UPI000A5CE438|nr:hypothetical protein [Mycolicibacterium holsaticum]